MENFVSIVMQNLILILKTADLKNKQTKNPPQLIEFMNSLVNFLCLPLLLKK